MNWIQREWIIIKWHLIGCPECHHHHAIMGYCANCNLDLIQFYKESIK